jgi:hypothetical protein
MKVDVKVTSAGNGSRAYPKIRRSIAYQYLVWFSTPTVGIVVSQGTGTQLPGKYSNDWAPECFEEWTGEVVLTLTQE